eukprot:4426110-Pyramimonas_sp.AAC.2
MVTSPQRTRAWHSVYMFPTVRSHSAERRDHSSRGIKDLDLGRHVCHTEDRIVFANARPEDHSGRTKPNIAPAIISGRPRGGVPPGRGALSLIQLITSPHQRNIPQPNQSRHCFSRIFSSPGTFADADEKAPGTRTVCYALSEKPGRWSVRTRGASASLVITSSFPSGQLGFSARIQVARLPPPHAFHAQARDVRIAKGGPPSI